MPYQRSHTDIPTVTQVDSMVASVSISINKITEIFANIAHANTHSLTHHMYCILLYICRFSLLDYSHTHTQVFRISSWLLIKSVSIVNCVQYVHILALYFPAFSLLCFVFFALQKVITLFQMNFTYSFIAKFEWVCVCVCVCLCGLDLIHLQFLNNLMWICALKIAKSSIETWCLLRFSTLSLSLSPPISISHIYTYSPAYSFIKMHSI